MQLIKHNTRLTKILENLYNILVSDILSLLRTRSGIKLIKVIVSRITLTLRNTKNCDEHIFDEHIF